MAQMKITVSQCEALLRARGLSPSSRKAEKKRIMREVHKDHPILGGQKIKLFLENPDNPLYLVIRDKRTGMPIDDGVQLAVVPKAKKPAAVKKATPAKKAVVAKKAPAKKAAAKKPAAKKTVAKKAAKPAKK